jgi:antitoxin component YwqK of YwqJK toxin-antitoxin module
MNKSLTFILSITFLFLAGCSGNGEEPEVKKEFYDNGKLLSEFHIKNGKEEGLTTKWYESGEKKYEVLWKNGKQDGIRKEWDEDGKLTFQGNFVDGVEEIK